VRYKLKLALIALLLLSTCPCWAEGGKGNLNGKELDYLYDTFFPILIKAHVCTMAHGDCQDQHITCDSNEALVCWVYGITDEKVVKELFMSMLNSGLNFSSITFYRRKEGEVLNLFENPLLKYIDHTGGK